MGDAGVDPGFFLGRGALVSCSTSTPINHIVFFFFLQNTSCFRKTQVISGRGRCALPAPSPKIRPCDERFSNQVVMLNGHKLRTDSVSKADDAQEFVSSNKDRKRNVGIPDNFKK